MAPSQRYYASSTSNILHASEDGQDDADDFMSDKFVSAAASASAKEPMSYTQLRKEALRRKEERGYTKSRAEREKEAREQGLRRNILETTSSTTTSIASPSTSSAPTPPSVLPNTNKALGMMLRMGFKPGEALGKKTLPMSADLASASPSAEEEDADDGFIPLKEGTGSKRSASNALADPGSGKDRDQVDDRRIDPIEIQMRSGQADFTTCSLHLTQLILHTFITRDGELSVEDYRSRSRANHTERRAEGQLISARKTCQALDEAAGVSCNHIWLDPTEEYRRERAMAIGGERFGPKGRLGDFGAVDEGDEEAFGFGDDQGRSAHRSSEVQNEGKIEIEPEDEAFEDDEILEREEIKRDFLAQSARERLKRTTRYLRQEHDYCFWCGAKYDSKEEMDSECPGEEEEDH
ncbi:MAG: hypothetical protein CYPHOPRED_003453 [Cyphobasidiales sp. Tagirdzhanova-0007]|nr:MAG: hypothetical protein CYPHOPRED_003453 [Cyphobasidiales sp. Tagirdzhanova-0007]